MAQAALSTNAVSQALQGFAGETGVLTAEGALPVEYLAVGDRIVTRSGLRVLRGVTVQVVRRITMVWIGGDTLGVGRPAASLVIAPGQAILIRDWRAQALFGKAQAMIAAGRLIDGELIRPVAMTNMRLYSLYFDSDEVIYAGGLELGCAAARVAA